MNELNEMGCDEFGDVAAELALGVLTGRERAQAIAHLDHCDACRENVRQLTMTSEEMLGLLPAMEPPAGFESRVMERIGVATPSPHPVSHISRARSFGKKLNGWTGGGQVGRPRRMLAAAAVAATVVVGGLGGWALHGSASSPSSSALSSATLLSASHQSAGEIFVHNGNPRWMYMSVNVNSGSSSVTCQLVGADGHITTVGSFQLVGGYGYWGSPIPANIGTLTGARLVSTNGTVLATASL